MSGTFWSVLLVIVAVGWGWTALAWAVQPIEGDPARAAPSDVTRRGAGGADATVMSSDPTTGVLPVVRLTPREVTVAGLELSRLDLNGEWDFVREVPAGFDGTTGSVEGWRPVRVPGHFALQGFERMHAEEGVAVAWLKRVEVPAAWAGRRVVLRFEAVDGLTRLWVNGVAVGESDLACLPSEFDITERVRVGEANEIVLTVEKSLVTRWSRRELGSITRPVYLQALPTVNLARLHVDTRVSPSREWATADVHLRIANQSGGVVSGHGVMLYLLGENGARTAVTDKPTPLPAVAAGQMQEVTIPVRLERPRLWTAETPNLYRMEAELLVPGSGGDVMAVMTARQRFGVREVQVDGHRLLVNGTAVRLRGTNYHITAPGLGESVPRELMERDIRLLRDANFNALRSRPTPSHEYAALCDELGMYTTVEAMISLMMYDRGPKQDHGADPAIAAPLRYHVAAMIESLYSHPSILTWGLGNECPYYDYFRTAALGMRVADRTRPLFFGSDDRLGVGIALMDINDDHYPRDGVTTVADPGGIVGKGWDYPTDRPNIFTEWMHVHTNNVKEIDFDPGIDDFWGYVAEAHIEFMYRTPHFAGGFHFKGAPYRGVGVNFPWRGVFDDDRRPNETYWHVVKAHSPVRVSDRRGRLDAGRGVAVFEVENRFDFTNLSGVVVRWRRGGEGGRVRAEVAAQSKGVIEVPWAADSGEPTELEVRYADGRLIDRYVLSLADAPAWQVPVAAVREGWEVRDEPGSEVVVTSGEVVVTVSRETGLLSRVEVGGKVVVDGSPTLSVLPSQLMRFRGQQKRTLVNQAVGWTAEAVRVLEREGGGVRVETEGRYSQLRGRFVTEVDRTGEVRLGYDFEWTGGEEGRFNCFSWGLAVPVSESLDRLRWERAGQWTAYPAGHIGRPVGEAVAWGGVASEGYAGSQEKVDGVTRDFRATRFFTRLGGLFDASGTGVQVVGGGERHVQAVPRHGDVNGQTFEAEVHGPRQPGFFLNIWRFHNGGTEPHLTKSLVFDTLVVGPGTRFSDEVTLRWVK